MIQIRNFFFGCLPLFLASSLCAGELGLPGDHQVVSGALISNGGGWSAGDEKRVEITGAIPESESVMVFQGRLGTPQGKIVFQLQDATGKQTAVYTNTKPYNDRKEVYPDSYIGFGWPEGLGWSEWCARPSAIFYHPKEWEKRKTEWKQLPGASQTSFKLEFRHDGGERLQTWVNGQFVQQLQLGKPVNYRVWLEPGAILESLQHRALQAGECGDAITLPVEAYPREGGMEHATLRLDNAQALPAGMQISNGAAREGVYLGGLGRFNSWRFDDLQSFFWRRSASNNLPEQRMFSVPLAVYSHAWVLCAAADDPAQVKRFVLRITRYGTSRGNGVADTEVEIPTRESVNARKVGRVSYGPQEARREAALWLIRAPIRNGLIQDVLHDDKLQTGRMRTLRYLDVDLLDNMEKIAESQAFPPIQAVVSRSWKPVNPDLPVDIFRQAPPTPPAISGVTVFAMQLAKSPAVLKVAAAPAHKAFYADDKGAFIANVQAMKSGDYNVEWTVADVEGAVVDSGKKGLKLQAGEAGEVRISVKEKIGWFATRTRLLTMSGDELADHRSSYVMMPPDTRKAGYESPFYGGWFGKGHGADVKLEEAGPMMQRLGIRRVMLGADLPESVTSAYQFTEATIPWDGARILNPFRDKKISLQDAVKNFENYLREKLELWPSADRVLIFHESGSRGAPFPTEMWGVPAKNFSHFEDINSPQALLERGGNEVKSAESAPKDWSQNWPARIEFLKAAAPMVREKFPQLKLQYGNDGSGLGIMGELFRQKFPKEYIDTIGVEDLGQTIPPEHLELGGLHSAWFLRETARRMGYGDKPITACTEWIGRMTERLGLKKHAEWKVRDGLLALAYGFDTINLAWLNDAGDAYYFSIWANGGLCGRYPEMAPKPAFLAVSTLTQVLDCAKFQRFVPTGSPVLYLQEYQRGDQWIYPLWTPRGTREVRLDFGKKANRTLVDLYGREKKVAGEGHDLTAETSVHYLVSNERIQAVKAGASRFPEDVPPAKVQQEIVFKSLSDVEIAPNAWLETISRQRPENLPHRRQGKAEIREVVDEEMGPCLEVELVPEGEQWAMEQSYVHLKLAHPVPTKAGNAGLWIKGNGSWGAVDISNTQGWGPWATNGNLHMRWSAEQKMNFEGWNFINYPYYDWIRKSDNSVTGLTLTLPRQVLVGTEMEPVKTLKVRIKKMVLY